jgi:ribonucleoside-diphosphate reductase subunit M1
MAREAGKPYDSYPGSPISQGILQFDMWPDVELALDWAPLRAEIRRHGVYNSLLIALMPTASGTQNANAFCECFEPPFSNLYKRQTMWGDYIVINPFLVDALVARGLHTPELVRSIIAAKGSVQDLAIPDDLKAVFKTIAEIKLSTQLQYAADRGAFVDQACSQNVYIPPARNGKSEADVLANYLFQAHRLGLKCASYYTRIPVPETTTLQFSLPPKSDSPPALIRAASEDDDCRACSI